MSDSLHGGFRLLAADEDLTGGAIRRPHEIVRGLVGRADPVIFDVGAATGSSVERFLATFERPTIHSFEPQTAAFSELYRRFGRHAGVHLNNLALADRTGIASLHRTSFADSASLLPLAEDSWWMRAQNIVAEGEVTTALDTIDRYAAAQAVETIDLLKLDIQGAEPECLRGAHAMLAAGRIRVIQTEIITHGLYTRAGSVAAIETLLAPHGFRLFTIFEIMIAPSGELLQFDAVYARA
jgi:FkbM family methyltransferase